MAAEVAFDDDGDLAVHTPITGHDIGRIRAHTADEMSGAVDRAVDAFRKWRLTPAPVRGQLVRALGERLREHHDDLAELVIDRGRENPFRGPR